MPNGPLRLSVLDVRGLVEDTVALAPHVEQLGYERYWIAEHQPQPSPTLIAAIVAGLTERIRVGTAGVLLHYYMPRRVAHDFHFLERAYTGRIDAGFCAGMDASLDPHDDGRDYARIIAAYPERAAKLVAHLRNTPGTDEFDIKTGWLGALETPPEVWSLGGGMRSAELAAKHGLSLGYSLLYRQSIDDPAAIAHYRASFQPHPAQPAPRAVLAVCGSCAATRAAAQQLTAAVPDNWFMPRVVGEPSECAEQLRTLAERYGVDEIVFADRIPEIDARKRCYELLAEALR